MLTFASERLSWIYGKKPNKPTRNPGENSYAQESDKFAEFMKLWGTQVKTIPNWKRSEESPSSFSPFNSACIYVKAYLGVPHRYPSINHCIHN